MTDEEMFEEMNRLRKHAFEKLSKALDEASMTNAYCNAAGVGTSQAGQVWLDAVIKNLRRGKFEDEVDQLTTAMEVEQVTRAALAEQASALRGEK